MSEKYRIKKKYQNSFDKPYFVIEQYQCITCHWLKLDGLGIYRGEGLDAHYTSLGEAKEMIEKFKTIPLEEIVWEE